jgi:hypothetical protein
MPVSKHYKKGLTARQWRKKRNLAREQARLEHGAVMRRAFQNMMQQQEIAQAEEQAVKEVEEKENEKHGTD